MLRTPSDPRRPIVLTAVVLAHAAVLVLLTKGQGRTPERREQEPPMAWLLLPSAPGQQEAPLEVRKARPATPVTTRASASAPASHVASVPFDAGGRARPAEAQSQRPDQ